MVSFTRKFVSIGNRRDKNLSDITDQKQSLTNVLDTIIGDGTFIADDLQFLDGLSNENINSGYLSRLANTTVKTIQDGVEVVATPLVTIKDRVENAKDVTGKIPPNIGGLGLTARFIESTEVNVGNINSTGADIFVFNNKQIIEPNYWEYGLFQHQSLFDASFKNEYGGIQWTGYFSPNALTPSTTINVSTTGLLLIEYDLNETNIWTKVVNLYAQTRPIIPTSSGTSTIIPINSALSSHLSIFVGDKLLTNQQITVTGVSATQITLSNPITFVLNQPVSFTTVIGEDVKGTSFSLPTVEPGKEYVKLRISYWFPNNNLPINLKYLYFTYINNGTLPFQYLYSELPINPPGANEYRTFINSALSPYNNTLGNAGVLGSGYKSLTIKRTYINEYEPKNSLNGNITDQMVRDLSSLTSITINHSNIAQIPTFSNSPLLSYINVDNNALSGTIPNFGNKSNFRSFSASSNSYTALPAVISSRSLTNFVAVSNQIAGAIPDYSNLVNLTTLNLNNNQITDYTVGSFATMTFLQVLDLGNNLLTTDAVDDILRDMEKNYDARNRRGVQVILSGPNASSPSPSTEIIDIIAKLQSANWSINVK